MRVRRLVIVLSMTVCVAVLLAALVLRDAWRKEEAALPRIAPEQKVTGAMRKIAKRMAADLVDRPAHADAVIEPLSAEEGAEELRRKSVDILNAQMAKQLWEAFEGQMTRPRFAATEEQRRHIVRAVRKIIEEHEQVRFEEFDVQSFIEARRAATLTTTLGLEPVSGAEHMHEATLSVSSLDERTNVAVVAERFYRPAYVHTVARKRSELQHRIWAARWAALAGAIGFGLMALLAVVQQIWARKRASDVLRTIAHRHAEGFCRLEPETEAEARRYLPHSRALRAVWDAYVSNRNKAQEIEADIEADRLEMAHEKVKVFPEGPERERLESRLRGRLREVVAERQARLRESLSSASQLVGSGRLQDAAGQIETAESVLLQLPPGAADGEAMRSEATGTLDGLSRQMQQRREQARELTEQARQALGAGELSAALNHARSALAQDADNQQARELVQRIELAQSVTGKARTLVASGQLDEAETLLSSLHPSVAGTGDPIAQQIRDRRVKAQQLLMQANELLCDGDLDGAEGKASQARRQDGQDSAVGEFLEKIAGTRQWIERAQSELDAANLTAAANAIDGLEGDVKFLAAELRKQIEERREQALSRAETARTALREADVTRARSEAEAALALDADCPPALEVRSAIQGADAATPKRLVPVASTRSMLLTGQGELLVGRRDADLVIARGEVSSRHLKITLTERQVFAEDLGSKNGSTVAGQPLRGARALVEDGVIVGVGNVEGLLFRIHRDGAVMPAAQQVDRTMTHQGDDAGSGSGSGSRGSKDEPIGAVEIQPEHAETDVLLLRSRAPIKASGMGVDLSGGSEERLEVRSGLLFLCRGEQCEPVSPGATVKISGFEFKVEAVEK